MRDSGPTEFGGSFHAAVPHDGSPWRGPFVGLDGKAEFRGRSEEEIRRGGRIGLDAPRCEEDGLPPKR